MIGSLIKTCLVLALFGLISVRTAPGQNAQPEDLYVPKGHLKSFQAALARFTECYTKHDWNCVFDLTYKPTLKRSEFVSQKATKNLFYDFSKLKKMNLMLAGKFIDKLDGVDSWFSIHGCLEFSEGKPNLAETQAYLVNGKWFFGGFMPWAFPRGVEDRPCKMEEFARESTIKEIGTYK